MTRVDSGGLATIRSEPVLAPRGYYLSVAPRTTIFSGQVNGAAFSDTATLGYYGFNYDNTTGTYSNVLVGMSIDFGSTAGARDLGTTYVRKALTGDGKLYVPETPPGEIPIADNVYFTVKDEYRPWLRIPRGVGTAVGTTYTNTLTLYIDYDEAYSDQNRYMKPKANISALNSALYAQKPAGFVDAGQTYRTVTFSSAWSYAPQGGVTIASRLWNVGDGTITVGSTTTTDITVRFPVGFRHVRLTVTDTNGKTGTMVFPIWVHSAAALPLNRFLIRRDNTNEWREMEFEFYEQDTDETNIPKGSTVCFWEDVQFASGTTPKEYRGQFLGWTAEDVTHFQRYKPRAKLIVKGLGGWLSGWRGFSQRIQDKGTVPVSWFEMEDITLNRLVHYLSLNFSTAHLVGNLFLATDVVFLKALDITLGNLWQQLVYIMTGNYGRVRCDSLNSIWVRPHFSYSTTGSRDSGDPVIDLTPQDWPDDKPIEIGRRFTNPSGSVHGTGASFDGTDNTLLASRAPGRTPGMGEATVEAPFQNLPNPGQTELNRLTGMHWAYVNNQRGNVQVELIYNLDVIEPAWGEPISITAGSEYTRSGLALANDFFLVREINVAYDNPLDGKYGKHISLTMEGDTSGRPGQTEIVPVDETDPDDREPPIDIPYVPPVEYPPAYPEYEDDIEPTELIVFDSGGAHCHIARAINLTTGVMIYEDASAGLTGYTVWATADPYNYGRYFALQSTGLYRNESPFDLNAWTLVADNDTIFGTSGKIGGDVQMSINRKGYIIISSGLAVAISFNYGSSWGQYKIEPTGSSVSSDFAAGFSINYAKLHVSPYNNPGASNQGWVYAGTRYGGYGFFLSKDWGQTWTLKSSPDTINSSPHPHVPYIRTDGSTPNINDDGQEVFLQGHGGANSTWVLLATFQGSSIATYVYETGGGNTWAMASALTGRPMSTFTWDGRKYASACGREFGGGSGLTVLNDTPYFVDVARDTFGYYGDSSQGWSNRYSDHAGAVLFGNRTYTYLIYTLDKGATPETYVALPSGYAGSAYAEWSLRSVIPPSA